MTHFFSTLTATQRRTLLEPPRGTVRMVLDTDTYNEIDDQFALVYALLSSNLQVEAIYAAPFFNNRSSGPGDGMEKSYEEIVRVLDRMGLTADGFVFRGSDRYLPSLNEPVHSAAAEDLVRRALSDNDEPLYVVAIGAITNVASALLLEPAIANRIVVVWLGGEPPYWSTPQTRAFNLWQDIPAARVIFDSGVPVVHVPCTNVAEHLRTTLPEIVAYIKGRGAIGDYLYGIFRDCHPDQFAYSRVLWDVCNIAYLVNLDWTPSVLRPSPRLRDDWTWDAVDSTRHEIREIVEVNRDRVFGDFFRKLAAQNG